MKYNNMYILIISLSYPNIQKCDIFIQLTQLIQLLHQLINPTSPPLNDQPPSPYLASGSPGNFV